MSKGIAFVTVLKLTVYCSTTRVVSVNGEMYAIRNIIRVDTEVMACRSMVSGVCTEIAEDGP